MKDSTFITRVILKNYKSIAACDVQLQPLTFLVGRNGSGKSNFLDALRFVTDALNLDRRAMQYAIVEVSMMSDAAHVGIQTISAFVLNSLPYLKVLTGHYAFRIGTRSSGGYEVQTEECQIQNEQLLGPAEYFRVDKWHCNRHKCGGGPGGYIRSALLGKRFWAARISFCL